jgi:small GTP-binding protein
MFGLFRRRLGPQALVRRLYRCIVTAPATSGRSNLSTVLVGTKSVGKSTLFNSLVGERLAIVDATPGTTRDWKQGLGALGSLRFNVIDTPGIDPAEAASDKLAKGMLNLTMGAISKAQVLLYVVDWRLGVTDEDSRLCRLIKQHVRAGPPKIYIVANKAEVMTSLLTPPCFERLKRWYVHAFPVCLTVG